MEILQKILLQSTRMETILIINTLYFDTTAERKKKFDLD